MLDLKRERIGDKEPVITKEADIHHLLQQNMYQTRRIVSTSFMQSNITSYMQYSFDIAIT